MNKLLNIGQWTLGVFFGLMALTGLLSFSLYGIGIFGAFMFSMALTIPPILEKIREAPILEKIREANKKQGKEISTNFAVLGAGFFAICGIVFMINSGMDTITGQKKAEAPVMTEAEIIQQEADKIKAEKESTLHRQTYIKIMEKKLTKTVDQWVEGINNQDWEGMVLLIDDYYASDKTYKQLVNRLRSMYEGYVILSHEIKSIKVGKFGMSFRVLVELKFEEGFLSNRAFGLKLLLINNNDGRNWNVNLASGSIMLID